VVVQAGPFFGPALMIDMEAVDGGDRGTFSHGGVLSDAAPMILKIWR
jgi:hypothetical protein